MEKIVEKINCIRDERLDLLEKLQEHREEVVHVLSNMPSITLQDLSETLKMYYSLRDEILSMIRNMDIVEQKLVDRLHHT